MYVLMLRLGIITDVLGRFGAYDATQEGRDVSSTARMMAGLGLLVCGVAAALLSVYLFALYQLQASCLGGQGRGPCPVNSVTMLLLVLSAVTAVGGIWAGAFLARSGMRTKKEAYYRDLISSGRMEEE